jgi:hypothetical protein
MGWRVEGGTSAWGSNLGSAPTTARRHGYRSPPLPQCSRGLEPADLRRGHQPDAGGSHLGDGLAAAFLGDGFDGVRDQVRRQIAPAQRQSGSEHTEIGGDAEDHKPPPPWSARRGPPAAPDRSLLLSSSHLCVFAGKPVRHPPSPAVGGQTPPLLENAVWLWGRGESSRRNAGAINVEDYWLSRSSADLARRARTSLELSSRFVRSAFRPC